jgi:hypothetical protein
MDLIREWGNGRYDMVALLSRAIVHRSTTPAAAEQPADGTIRLVQALEQVPSNLVSIVIEESVVCLQGIVCELTSSICAHTNTHTVDKASSNEEAAQSWMTVTQSLIAIASWYLDKIRSFQMDTRPTAQASSVGFGASNKQSKLINSAMLGSLKLLLALFTEFGVCLTLSELTQSSKAVCLSVAQHAADIHANNLLRTHVSIAKLVAAGTVDEDLLVPSSCKRLCSLLEIDVSRFAHMVFKVIVVKNPVRSQATVCSCVRSN